MIEKNKNKSKISYKPITNMDGYIVFGRNCCNVMFHSVHPTLESAHSTLDRFRTDTPLLKGTRIMKYNVDLPGGKVGIVTKLVAINEELFLDEFKTYFPESFKPFDGNALGLCYPIIIAVPMYFAEDPSNLIRFIKMESNL